jgi:tetratricopeptide (TPR) repeat protein
MSDILTQRRFIRSVGLSIEDEGLRFFHDYGELFFPWGSISHAFTVILKKKILVNLPFFVFLGEDTQAFHYIDGNTISFKFLKTVDHPDEQSTSTAPLTVADARKSKEEEFKRIIREICSHLTTTYIDKPLVAYLKGNKFFLPECSTLKDLADYVARVKGSLTEEDLKGAEVLEEEALVDQVMTTSKEREEFTPGTVLEDIYTIQEVLHGGMGTVYIVFDSKQVEFHAMKTFQEAYLWNEKVIKQFIKEAEIWVNLERHPHIVQAKKVKMIEGKPYIILEYVAGTDLSRLLDKETLTLQQSLEFSIQFCEGMSYAFMKLGLIHRDIKPANCMITREGVLKITDFGLGKLRTEQQAPGSKPSVSMKLPSSKSSSGSSKGTSKNSSGSSGSSKGSTSATGITGTLTFMAPELFSEAGSSGIKSDIYAFGIVLYMMLAGVNPFQGENSSKTVSNHLMLEPESPAIIRKETPLALSELVMKCLHKEPSRRYDNFDEIKTELRGIYRTATGVEYVPIVGKDVFSEEDWLNKGLSLDSLGRFNEAVLTFDRALSLNPSSLKALVHKSRSLLNSGKVPEALSCIDEGMKLDPLNGELWFYKGECNWKLGDKDRALQCFDQALELVQEGSVILGRKGRLLFELNRHDDALACYDAALAENSRAADIWTEKGSLLISMKRFEAALDCINQSLEINPRSRDALYHQGRALFSLGFFSKAIDGLEKCLAIDKDFGDAWVMIGDCYRENGNNAEALKAYRTAIKIQPQNVQAYLSCIMLLKETGAYEEAVSFVDRAIETDPENSRLLLEGVEILLNLGYLEDSLDLCNHILHKDEDNEDAKLLLSTILKWSREQEAIFKSIFATPPVSFDISFHDLNELLSIFCSSSDALVHLNKAEGNDYLKACLYLVESRQDLAHRHCEMALTQNDTAEKLSGLKRLIEDQVSRDAPVAPRKKGFLTALFKKTETVTEPEIEKKVMTAEQLLILGLVRMRDEHYSEARDCFRESQALDSAFHSCRFFIGKAYDLEGKTLKALYNYDDFHHHVPQSLGYWKVRLATSSISSPIEAEAIYHRWIGGYPYDWHSWNSYLLYLTENNYCEKVRLLSAGLLKSSFTHWKRHEGTAYYWNMKGLLELYIGRNREAEKSFSRSLELNACDTTALLGMGKCIEKIRSVDEAMQHYKKLMDNLISDKENTGLSDGEMDERVDAIVNTAYFLADLCMKEKLFEKALRTIELGLEKKPDSLVLQYKKAHIIACSGRLQEFINYSTQLQQSHGQFMAIKILRSACLAENHKIDDATAEMMNMLSLGSINLAVLKNLGFTYIQSLNPNKAFPLFEKIQSIYTLDFEVCLGRAMTSYLLRNFEDAHDCLDRALEMNPANADLWQFIAALKFHLGERGESLKCWERAIGHRSHFTQAWANKGAFHCQLGEYEQALECVDRSLRIDPEYHPAWICRAECQWKTGSIQEAIKCVQKALALAPQNPRGWVLQGVLEYYAGIMEISFQSFDRAVQCDKQNIVSWFNRALVSLHLKNNPEVRRSIDRALALNSRHFESLVARFIFERSFSQNVSEDVYLAPAREADPELFRVWMEEFRRTGNPLTPLRPLESMDDPFTLPFAKPLITIEPLQLFNLVRAKSDY